MANLPTSAEPRQASVSHITAMPWQEFPGHFGGALSKALVRPETCGARLIDHRISHYQPMADVAEHVHQTQEQVYPVLEGEGRSTLDEAVHLRRRHDFVFVPPGVRHGFKNTGLTPLVFLVVTNPVEDGQAPL